MQFDFTGKIIIVTGGTRGIGKSIAEHFAALGGEVIATGTDLDRLSAAQGLTFRRERRANYFHLDFLEDGSCDSFVTEVEECYGRVDILVNNAGINEVGAIGETSTVDFENVMKVNVTGPLQLLQETSVMMKKNGYGRIVNVASIFGVVARDKRVSYITSKNALIGLTKAAAVDLAPYNILVNAVSPGFVATEMTKRMLADPRERDALLAKVPLRRCAEPDEIAKVVLFLTSDLNTFITAQNIIVDGGFVSV
ncbi:MAG: SDR family NAD(P)-dependent oxidoreductase [bacterium]|nr:SDR family NAD(P)-dependent oxidoreductase [bacterium]